MIFCTHQGKCMPNMSINAHCYSFCCLKWRYLVKFLPLDNAASKLKPNGLLTVILTYAADLTQMSFTVFVSCKQNFKF